MALGRGELVAGGACEGELQRADGPKDVVRLLKRHDLSELILLCESASATAITPLLPKVRGIVCLSGGRTSHVAIVSREFGLTAVMSAEIDGEGLEGTRVRIGDDGEITAA